MSRMVRKQIVLEPELERELAARARVLGVSQSALVREAIDRYLHAEVDEAERRRAWDEVLRGVDRAAELNIGSGGRKWTREEIHER